MIGGALFRGGTEEILQVDAADKTRNPYMGKVVGDSEHFLGDGVVVDKTVGGVDDHDSLADGVEDRLHESMFAREKMDVGIDGPRVHGVQLGGEFAEKLVPGHKCHTFSESFKTGNFVTL
ncbi:hypothetical protein SDC9_196189 [bioreactor metagenome]|uniref:Uncharacterized protein n=1 Tax=bioreactor metagenome TaxID=1076179 RepID=A0A645IDP1_9ZZZZ